MKLSPFLRPAAVAACALAPLLAGAGGGAAPAGAPAQLPRDTTLEFATGDAVRVSVRPMGATGVEVCAALGPGMRGGKTLYAENNGRTSGAGLPTTLRFPGAGVTPACIRHGHTAGDTVYFWLTRQARDAQGRLGRLSVGGHALPLAALQRRRVTFRWLRDAGQARRDTTVE